jgi:putative molybdopterin biosynthesis protein
VRADGITILPRGSQGAAAGAPVQVRLYRAPAELERTIFAIGSHDMTLDLMAQFLAERGRRLASANVGSLGGLVALQRGEAHLAGSHLLDPQTGEYNRSYIAQYLAERHGVRVRLVGRAQGLLVAPGNPKGITNLTDLARPEVQYVNRQRGAGTRVLLDYELGKLGLMAADVRGYELEEYTHLGVAAAILGGRADAGLGIAAAAAALGLDFVPLYEEQYELIVPQEYWEGALLAPLRAVLADTAFQAAVAALPGYTVAGMGSVTGEF